MKRVKVLIMGAAGRDFHNFNVYFRDNPGYEVVCFTATQIPDIEGRQYPPVLSGPQYPEGIPIYPEGDLDRLMDRHGIERVVFAYSDVSHEFVMHQGSRVLAQGADYWLMGPGSTMLRSSKKVVGIGAVRTGAGKSQTTRRVCEVIKEMGKVPVVVRHPMPYGDLARQAVQRFATYEDLDKHDCTIEEREEYEPHLNAGSVVYAGVDYEAILRQAETEADVVVWDGGNNDVPFYSPDLYLVVADPHRPGHEALYHPGETNLRMADVIIINKIDTADYANVLKVRENIDALNPGAQVIEAASPVFVENADSIRGKSVLVIEDGPTLTHGGMPYGAGVTVARKHGARTLLDPRPYAQGSILNTFEKYPHIGALLPAMGYGDTQVKELEATINACPVDLVVIATPIDLRRVARIDKPAVRVGYELQEIGYPTLEDVLGTLWE